MNDPTWFAASDTATVHVIANPQATTAVNGARLDGVTCVMPAESLRTVPMPDLRTPDAEARDLRTAGDKLAELTQRLASVEDRLAALEARPLVMAEDVWGVG